MRLIRILLFPLVPIYYLVSSLRNWFYDRGILYSEAYEIPVICVGNLSTGGTGKTPMVEYLLRLLKDKKKVAVLSRGYKRKTSGFLLAVPGQSRVEELGDEPFQMMNKFPNVQIAVHENRRKGIELLLNSNQPPEIIILDDAFQHRRVKAGFNILLTSYDVPFTRDLLLPTGNLREPIIGRKRADVTILTKCPENLDGEEVKRLKSELSFSDIQPVLFSSIEYDDYIYSESKQLPISTLLDKEVTLVTGIANPGPMVAFLKSLGVNFNHKRYGDHHAFNESEIRELNHCDFVLATEKDFSRLKENLQTALYYLPIRTKLWEPELLNQLVLDFVDA